MNVSRLVRLIALVVPAMLLSAGCDQQHVRFADGSGTELSHWEGRWLVINYWAEWCEPCRKEIPELNDLHHDRTATGIVVLGVNYDGIANPQLIGVARKMGIEFPVLMKDPMQRWDYPRPQRLPTTVVLDPDRRVADVLEGPQTRKTLEFIVAVGEP